MALYQVTFTETNNPLKPPITVEDLTINTQTSVTFIGKNYSGYGPLIAKNFLHLLENFSGPSKPLNAIQGQLWFDNSTGVSQLKVNIDGTQSGWTSAGGVKKSPSAPTVATSIQGDLWVDTVNQQLSLYTGSNWLLVGPTFSQGSQTGPKLETIVDTLNISHTVQSIYVENKRVMIISPTAFTPKSTQSGFTQINKGINLYSEASGELYRLHGIATQADTISDPTNSKIPLTSSSFLRTDDPRGSTTNYSLNVRNAGGLTVGSDTGALTIFTESATNAATIYAKSGNSIDFKLNVNGSASTILHLDPNSFVGVNKTNPTSALDVNGSISADQLSLISTNASSLTLAGGIAISGPASLKTLDVNGELTVNGDIHPLQNGVYNIGAEPTTGGSRFASIYATNFYGNFNGTFAGGFQGSVSGSATKLASPTKFVLQGDVINSSNDLTDFDGQNQTITFNTILTTSAIASQEQVTSTLVTDELLLRRDGSAGLKKVTVQTLTAGFATVPVGSIIPFAGVTSKIPNGYLLCDGAEVSQSVYSGLFEIIEYSYKPSNSLDGFGTFALPDLRGRFALGRDNMFNNIQVSTPAGISIYTVTSPAGRVTNAFAQSIGGVSGAETVSITTTNLPEHRHSNRGLANNQYFGVRNVPGEPDDGDAFPGPGGQAAGQAQYLSNSGGVISDTTPHQQELLNIMNPYLAVNYIIFTGVTA
jgi:microcystin-dependent protein